MNLFSAPRFWILAACLAFPLPPVTAGAAGKPAAATPPLLAAPYREAIERGVANGAYRTLALGLIDGQRHGTFYFGHRDGADSKPADDDSLFEIGAAGEVFTGLLLAQAVIEGKLRFSDPVEKILPAPFPFADPRLGGIALGRLATHHSGLPAQPPNLFPADPDDPYADYGAEDLLALLALQRADAARDGSEYGYSVLDAGLLGHLLGRVYRTSFGEALAAEVFAPLGLSHMTFADPPNLLPGHAGIGPAPHWHFGALAGAAGLRASLPDLLAFLQHNLTPEDSPRRAALLLARQPRAAGPADQPGLGWNVRETLDGATRWPLVWRASATAGFASFIGFRIDEQKAIVVLGNSSEEVAALGIAWLSGKPPPAAPRGPASKEAIRLGDYPGLYRIAPGTNAIVRVSGDALSLQLPGQLPVRLRAADKDIFIADSGALGATFMREADEVSGFMLHTDEGNVSVSRLSANAPRLLRAPGAGDAAELAALPGDYRLDEAAWIRIGGSARQRTLQWTMGERRNIFPYAPGRYADADGTVDLHVEREADGRIAALILDLAGVPREAVPLYKNGKTP